MGIGAQKRTKTYTNKIPNRWILSYLIAFLFACNHFAPINLYAQYVGPNVFLKEQYQFEQFHLPGGKIENIIQCIAQDSTGILWFGTQNWLVKYDGREYHRYLHNPLDSGTLISSYIEGINNNDF